MLNDNLQNLELMKYQDFVTEPKDIAAHGTESFSITATPPEGYTLVGFVNLCTNYPSDVVGDISISGNTLSGYMGNTVTTTHKNVRVKARALFIKNSI